VMYCKTLSFRVPFILRISRPWWRRKTKGSQIFEILCYFCVLLSPTSKNTICLNNVIDWTAKFRAAKFNGFYSISCQNILLYSYYHTPTQGWVHWGAGIFNESDEYFVDCGLWMWWCAFPGCWQCLLVAGSVNPPVDTHSLSVWC